MVSNIPRDELENELINLKSRNAAQALKIDDYEQKMYELKRQLSTAKAMEEHLTAEIESLQRNDKSESNDLLKKIAAFEDEIHNLKKTNAENVQFYESELQIKRTEIEALIETTKAKPELSLEANKDEIIKYTDEICDLKLKIEELSEQLVEYETKYQEVSLKNNSLENQIIELSSQLREVKDCLQAKKEELEESKELVGNLQDEMIMLQLDVDKLKSLPMEKAAKGNSLFAEVDDNRVKLQRTLENMKKKYMVMRTQYSSKCQELQKLHMEYAALIKVVENKNDASEEKLELEQAYERHFDRLEENIKSLENEVEIQKHSFTKLISKDWKCAREMISVTREEVQDLQRKLNAESLGLLTSESNHYKTKRELKKWQAEAMQLRAKIVSLNQTIDDLKLLKSPTETSIKDSNIYKKSCLKNTPALFSQTEECKLDENTADFSLIKINDHKDVNCTAMANYSIFDTNSTKSIGNNLMDELNLITQSEDKESNKENTLAENITMNDTMACSTSRMRKVSFQESTDEPQKTLKLGGRKIITAKPIHIPSIKRN